MAFCYAQGRKRVVKTAFGVKEGVIPMMPRYILFNQAPECAKCKPLKPCRECRKRQYQEEKEREEANTPESAE